MTTMNIYDMADTWNDAGTTFTGMKMDVTDTASAAGSKLLDLLVGSTSKFNVGKGGNVVQALSANLSALAVTGYSLTGANAQSLIDLAGTWNTTGAPTAIKLNVTNTASSASALLIDLQVDGNSKFRINRYGEITIGGSQSINHSGNINALNYSMNGDTFLKRDAAGVFAQQNGTNAQTFRWYHSHTDSSNRQNGALKTAAGYVEVAAETAGTGADDIDVLLTPAGTGKVRFGSHSAIGAEAVTGYITIKDAGGTERKIAVVS